MSVQFGNWSFERHRKNPFDLHLFRKHLAPYGREGESDFRDEDIEMLFYRVRETEEAPTGAQPFRIGSHRLLAWDGRLDNRGDLVRELAGTVTTSDTDVAVVAAAYTRWDLACFPKLIGDWALSIWDSTRQQLILAKDFLGTRSLFYSVDQTRAQWCTVLDPLVLFAGRKFTLNQEYIAGWFGTFPDSRLTPYVGISAVPPSSYVLIRKSSIAVREFWRFSGKRIVRPNDGEYEEEFRQLFTQSVARRLRSTHPVLAELSGGMDSSSIVCVSDQVLRTVKGLTPRLDTVSYYSSDEPNWDELPYVLKVEELRGRRGTHLRVNTRDMFSFKATTDHFMATPGSLEPLSEGELEFSRVLNEGGYRVVLSGIGGDEVLGGVPTPSPLLADLLVSGRWKTLSQALFVWALALRIPVAHLLARALALLFTARLSSGTLRPPQWLSQDFRKAYSKALRGYPRRIRMFGSRPTFQDSIQTLEALRRQLSGYPLATKPCYRKLYPYLDRDLLEFLFAIPSDQLLKPGQRRSLMRRALTGIVPNELLQRKRKAFVIRGPLMAIPANPAHLMAMTGRMLGASIGIVLPSQFLTELEQARSGERVAITPIIRAFGLERWFRNVAHWNVLSDFDRYESNLSTKMATERLPTEQVS